MFGSSATIHCHPEASMNSMTLPTWLRVVLVAGIFVLAAGTGLFAYRWYNKPTR